LNIGNWNALTTHAILAQALDLDIPIISIDAKLEAFGIRRIW